MDYQSIVEQANARKAAQYRFVYFRPNPYSEEQLTVGMILVTADDERFSRFISTRFSNDLFAVIFGQQALEQFHFATNLMRKVFNASSRPIEMEESPTDLLEFGRVIRAMLEDVQQFMTSTLNLSSSLTRPVKYSDDSMSAVGQSRLRDELFFAATAVDSAVASRIFNGIKVPVGSSKIEVPIFGDRILGAPVSFSSTRIETSLKIAEAFISKFNFVRRVYNRQPVVYVLAPFEDTGGNKKALRDGLEELSMVADANQAAVKIEFDISDMARTVLLDEAA